MERRSRKAALRLVGRVMEGRNRYERFDSSAPVLVYCACRALAKRKRRSSLQVAILDFVCVLCCEHFFFWVFSVFGLCVPHANSVSVYFSFSLVVYRSFHYWFVLGEFDFTNISVIYLSYDVVSYQLSYYFMS